jgi:hypothetical protein
MLFAGNYHVIRQWGEGNARTAAMRYYIAASIRNGTEILRKVTAAS